MFESPYIGRRALLKSMASAVAAAFALFIWPAQRATRPFRIPASLGLLASRKTCRHARRQMQLQPCERESVDAAQAYILAPENASARARYEHQARQDFIAGRIAVIQGWIVADTEVALLSMIEGDTGDSRLL
jgi:hypothetical protein